MTKPLPLLLEAPAIPHALARLPYMALRIPAPETHAIQVAKLTGITEDGALELWILNAGHKALLWTDGTLQPLHDHSPANTTAEIVWQGRHMPPYIDAGNPMLTWIEDQISKGNTGMPEEPSVSIPRTLLERIISRLETYDHEDLARPLRQARDAH